MAVNLLTYDNYALPKLVVTSNIEVNISSTTIYIGSLVTATSLGTNAVYAGVSNSTLQFRGIASATTISIIPTTTTLLIELNTTAVTPGTYGSSSLIPQITLDSYGRVTAVTPISTYDAGSIYAKAMLYNTTTLTNGVLLGAVPALPTLVELAGPLLVTNGWSFGPTSTAELSMAVDGRIRYTGASPKTFLVTGTFGGGLSSVNGVKMEVRKNGSNAGLINNFFYNGDATGSMIIPLSVPITLSTNDYVSLWLGALFAVSANTRSCICAQLELING